MPEVGLVRLGQVALDVAQATVPRYRTAFSKHQFTQPQLLAVLCLMRYEDWTYREAEVRLAEHSELRRALRLRSVPDYTTLYRFLRRLDEAAITHALHEVVHRMALPGPRQFRDEFGHTPLSIEEDIPWKCRRLVVGTGAYGRLPVMKEVKGEADWRKVELLVLPTTQAIKALEQGAGETNAILHVTC